MRRLLALLLTLAPLLSGAPRPATAYQIGTGPAVRDLAPLLSYQGLAYKRRILKNLPAFGGDNPDYATIKSTYGCSYTYPQGFAIDWQADLLFVTRAPTGCSNLWAWIEVRKWSTGQYIETFSAGSNTSEGLEVIYNGSQRLLWTRGDTTGSLAAYDITTLPANLSRLTTPVQTQAVDLYTAWNIRNGVATVEKRTPSLGFAITRSSFYRYRTSDWTLLGTLDFDPLETGIVSTQGTNPQGDQIPKRQGLGAGDGFYVSMMGGFYGNGTAAGSIPYQYTGPKMFDGNGHKIADGVLEPQAVINRLAANGFTAARTEVEGDVVAPQGQTLVTPGTIISLMMTQGAADAGGATGGLTFLEEFSKDPAAIDFSPDARTYPALGLSYQALLTPRTANGLVDPVTGAAMTTLTQVLDFIAHMAVLPSMRFYTSSVTNITDLNGAAFPTGTEVTIESRNNGTFWMVATNTGRTKEWQITGTPGTGPASSYTPGTWAQTLRRSTAAAVPTPVSGRSYFFGPPTSITGSPGNIGTGKMVLVPVFVGNAAVTANALCLRITTAAAGNFQMALYAPVSDDNPLPGLLLGSTASTSTGTAGIACPTLLNTGGTATPYQLTPGLYWIAEQFDNATALALSYAAGTTAFGALVGGSTPAELLLTTTGNIGGYSVPNTFGAFPADVTAATRTAITPNYIPVPGYTVN